METVVTDPDQSWIMHVVHSPLGHYVTLQVAGPCTADDVKRFARDYAPMVGLTPETCEVTVIPLTHNHADNPDRMVTLVAITAKAPN